MSNIPAEPPRRLDEATGAMTAASWSIVAAVVVSALYLGRDLLIPIALALLLAFVLSPMVSKLRRAKTPRGVAVASVVALAFSVILGLGAILAGQVGQLAGDLPQYQSTMRDKIQSLKGWTGGSGTLERAADMLDSLGEELNRPNAGIAERAEDRADPGQKREAKTTAGEPMLVQVREPPPTALQNLSDIIKVLLHPMATTGVIVVFVIFILLQREDLRNRLIGLAGARDIQRTTAAIDDAAGRLARLLLTQLVMNAGFGLAIGIGLYLIGVPSAGLWGIVAGVLRFVPYIGAFIAAVFPLLLAAAVDPGWTKFVLTAILFGGVEPIVGHVIEPMAYGRSTGLSPVAVVVSATFWTALWGPIGLILATPLTVCLVVLGRHVEGLRFLDVMFGDRPALSPPEIFYQRMLARDPAEAAEKAREFLKERSLSSYYEEVALPGLLLAQHDAERGALDGERIEAVRSSVADLVEDLDVLDDVDPAPPDPTTDPEAIDAIETVEDGATAADLTDAQKKTTIGPPDGQFRVRCVGGRTPIEAAASGIVAQILKKHGLVPQIEDEEFLLTTGVVEMEAAGPSIVCAVFLDASEANVRLVVRRIRKRLPSAHVVAGCWTSADRELSAEDLKQAARADGLALTLREVVGACLTEAKRRKTAPATARQSKAAAG